MSCERLSLLTFMPQSSSSQTNVYLNAWIGNSLSLSKLHQACAGLDDHARYMEYYVNCQHGTKEQKELQVSSVLIPRTKVIKQLVARLIFIFVKSLG